MLSINDQTLAMPDGTRIAYRVEGSGPALVLTNGLTTTTTFWKYVRPLWLRRHTVLTWDLPGHGQSGPAESAASARIETLPSVIARIMDAVGLQSAVQVGWSTGCQIVLETYRQQPARCTALIALFGPPGRALLHTHLPLSGSRIEKLVRSLPPAVFEACCRGLSYAMAAPGSQALGRSLGVIGAHAKASDMQQVIAHIGMVEPRTLQRMLLSAAEHSASEVLGDLRIPLLILGGDRDPFAPAAEVSVPMHLAAPGSELVRLPDGTHTALLEEPELIASTVEDFLRRTGASPLVADT